MRRRLFNIIALISALMFGVVVLFWVRSYANGDMLVWNNYFYIGSGDGLIHFRPGYGDGNRNRPIHLPDQVAPALPEFHGSFWPVQPRRETSKGDLRPGTVLGFKFGHWQNGGKSGVKITAPFWFLATLAAILPLIVIYRRIRSHRRNPFACLTCGYDLRATPDRCPECGTTTANGG